MYYVLQLDTSYDGPAPLYVDSSTHLERFPEDVWLIGCQLGATGGGRNTGIVGGLVEKC